MTALDASLVKALGLSDAAAAFARGARNAGLAPPSRFGTEVTARLLGLRTNHPTGQDSLELLPRDTATRAETAFSAARILGLGDWETDSVRNAALGFELPELTTWQRQILRTAVSFIGFPYVWGGTSENPQTPLGLQTPAASTAPASSGASTSSQAYPGAPQLSGTLRGRTTMQMSGEVPKASRIPFDELEPGDVLFFGARGRKSKPAQVNHTGIYLGNGWFIHSSGLRRRARTAERVVSLGICLGSESPERGRAGLEPISPDLVMARPQVPGDDLPVTFVHVYGRRAFNASVETKVLRGTHACSSCGGDLRRIRRGPRRHAPAVRLVKHPA